MPASISTCSRMGLGRKTILPTRHADSLWLWNSASEPPRLGPRVQPCLCTGHRRGSNNRFMHRFRKLFALRCARGARLPTLSPWRGSPCREEGSRGNEMATPQDLRGPKCRRPRRQKSPADRGEDATLRPACPVTRRNLRGRSTRHSVRLHRPPCRRRVLERNQRRT